MSNQITGRVVSVGQAQQIAGKDPSRPLIKRELVIDCTRYDPYTGERSTFENTPLLEFVGDICNELNYISVGDVVTISFDVEGRRYVGRDGEPRIFTRVRPYKILNTSPQPSTNTSPQPSPRERETSAPGRETSAPDFFSAGMQQPTGQWPQSQQGGVQSQPAGQQRLFPDDPPF